MTGEVLGDAAELLDRLWDFGGWEVAQTHESLLPFLLEETYELIDAVQSGDPAAVREELGDLLLQVLFHARIAEAADRFTVDDVAAGLITKLTGRSPHLSDPTVSGPIDVRYQEQAWEQRKAAEKQRASCLDGIAPDLPALALAEKVIERAGRAGLPADLVPPDLQTIRPGDPVGAEHRLRSAVRSFAAAVRAAEDAAAAERDGARAPLAPADWRRLLVVATAGPA
ncbi:MazG family protein [Skermania piniformis]|uniref:MazG family protein n=1 Tax=Skermania pinensis TaxID=39122 RepID=A0ABX8S9A6_9ACTN|nr:MazG family protein [Skermania piniformis]QXQ13080.1 MazG family protein [Skermania piniformis]